MPGAAAAMLLLAAVLPSASAASVRPPSAGEVAAFEVNGYVHLPRLLGDAEAFGAVSDAFVNALADADQERVARALEDLKCNEMHAGNVSILTRAFLAKHEDARQSCVYRQRGGGQIDEGTLDGLSVYRDCCIGYAQRLLSDRQPTPTMDRGATVRAAAKIAATRVSRAKHQLATASLDRLSWGIHLRQRLPSSPGAAQIRRLAHEVAPVARALLGGIPVCLWSDSVFVKEPVDVGRDDALAFLRGAGIAKHLWTETAWHEELTATMLDTEAFVTVWCPLSPLPANATIDSVLHYAPESHTSLTWRAWDDDAAGDDANAGKPASSTRGVAATDLYRAGDCTAHHGRTLHFAPPHFARAFGSTARRLSFGLAFASADAAVVSQARVDRALLRGAVDRASVAGWRSWEGLPPGGTRVSESRAGACW